jgi:O-antigen chain-terminating methyltransferase
MDRQRAVFGDQSYLEFEEQNRGTRADILARQKPYIAILSKVAEAVGEGAPFVDLGCGRGELLELASEAGLKMRGFDHDPGMVAYCRARGLNATQKDIFKCLEETTDGSLAGITAIQVIEHLPYHRIVRLVELAYQKLRAGGCLILETINPFSVYAMRHFYTDPSHIQPVPPTTAAFLVKARGFVDIRTLQLSPVENDPAQAVLKKDPKLAPLADFLFGYQDYAVVATKP